MSATVDAIEALGTVPGWDPQRCRITELKGGLTNRVYHVRSDDRECVLRLDARDVGHDRRSESDVMASAAAAGLAPAILHADADAGIFMTEYLHGRVWQEQDLESSDNLESLAQLLRRVHALPACGTIFDAERFADDYRHTIGAKNEIAPFASRCVSIVGSRSVPESTTCCHNDIVASNVIQSAGLKLIDWEYACDNDPLFDLASAIGYHDLGARQRQVLLGEYAGGAAHDLAERLAEQVRVYDALQWLWLAARAGTSPGRNQARRLADLQGRIR